MPMIRNGLRTRPKGTTPTPAGTGAIDPDLVRALATLLSESELAEMEIEKGDLRIKLVRHTAVTYAPQMQQLVLVAPASAAPAPSVQPPAAPEIPADHPGTVKSPMVGTVFRRASPEAKPFVEVGSTVKAGEKILLVEAMKTFNEIVAPRAGIVAAVLVEDGQPVEYGQPLLVIE
ncbi:MAG: acetyl-CoA carboxylase biotin carboxyl carrier protein [Janthinobacterium lividum]